MSDIPESLQHLHGVLALALVNEHGFNGKDALSVATACIAALSRGARQASPLVPTGDEPPVRTVPTKQPQRHENVEMLHNTLNLALMRKAAHLGCIPANELADDLCLELQRTFGGVGGFYLPVPVPLEHIRDQRNARIRRMAGDGPHSVALVRKIAREVRCHASTVWRVLSEGRDGKQ